MIVALLISIITLIVLIVSLAINYECQLMLRESLIGANLDGFRKQERELTQFISSLQRQAYNLRVKCSLLEIENDELKNGKLAPDGVNHLRRLGDSWTTTLLHVKEKEID